jgi:hypothetical protein
MNWIHAAMAAFVVVVVLGWLWVRFEEWLDERERRLNRPASTELVRVAMPAAPQPEGSLEVQFAHAVVQASERYVEMSGRARTPDRSRGS